MLHDTSGAEQMFANHLHRASPLGGATENKVIEEVEASLEEHAAMNDGEEEKVDDSSDVDKVAEEAEADSEDLKSCDVGSQKSSASSAIVVKI